MKKFALTLLVLVLLALPATACPPALLAGYNAYMGIGVADYGVDAYAMGYAPSIDYGVGYAPALGYGYTTAFAPSYSVGIGSYGVSRFNYGYNRFNYGFNRFGHARVGHRAVNVRVRQRGILGRRTVIRVR